jgi:imidazole glycerol-phosphate synthase subunit HisH
MEVLLIRSPFANLANIARALRAVGADVILSADPSIVRSAATMVLPGVGNFAPAARWLEASGIGTAIRTAVDGGSFLLGICVGHQLLFDGSEEGGLSRGLALVPGTVKRFDTPLPVPQIGWNVVDCRESTLFGASPAPEPFYFVNSYRAVEVPDEFECGTSEYGGRFTAAVQRGRVSGVQFHPEKSSGAGLRVLANFLGRGQ